MLLAVCHLWEGCEWLRPKAESDMPPGTLLVRVVASSCLCLRLRRQWIECQVCEWQLRVSSLCRELKRTPCADSTWPGWPSAACSLQETAVPSSHIKSYARLTSPAAWRAQVPIFTRLAWATLHTKMLSFLHSPLCFWLRNIYQYRTKSGQPCETLAPVC